MRAAQAAPLHPATVLPRTSAMRRQRIPSPWRRWSSWRIQRRRGPWTEHRGWRSPWVPQAWTSGGGGAKSPLMRSVLQRHRVTRAVQRDDQGGTASAEAASIMVPALHTRRRGRAERGGRTRASASAGFGMQSCGATSSWSCTVHPRHGRARSGTTGRNVRLREAGMQGC